MIPRGLWRRPRFFEEEDWPELTITEGLDVYEEDNKVVVKAAVPGIKEKDLEVTYEDGVLNISGRTEEKEEEKKKNRVVHKMERVSSFNYTTYLPRPIKADKIEASIEDGVVMVTAPVTEEAKPRRIPVKTAAKSK
jgi:HSP20 family protein